MDELEARLSIEELLEWQEVFTMEHEAHEKAKREAKAKRRR